MTGRERLTRILNGQPGDGLAWTTLVDDKTRSVMPASVRQPIPLLQSRVNGREEHVAPFVRPLVEAAPAYLQPHPRDQLIPLVRRSVGKLGHGEDP